MLREKKKKGQSLHPDLEMYYFCTNRIVKSSLQFFCKLTFLDANEGKYQSFHACQRFVFKSF